MAASQRDVGIQLQCAVISKVGKQYLYFLASCVMEEIWCFSKSSYFDGEMDSKRCHIMVNCVNREISVFPYGSKLICNFNLLFTVISQVEKGHAYLKFIVSSAGWGALTYFPRWEDFFQYCFECLLWNSDINEPDMNFFFWWEITVFYGCCFGYSIPIIGFIKECLLTSVTEAELDSKNIWVSVWSGWLEHFPLFSEAILC